MTSEPRRSTHKRLALLAAAVLVAVLVAVLASAVVVPDPGLEADTAGKPDSPHCVPVAGSARPAGPTPSVCSANGTSEPDSPALGAYVGYDIRGVKRIKEFSTWLGGAKVRVGHTYLPGDLWSNIEGRRDFLDVWAEWRRAKDDRVFVLNVPLMEQNEADLPDSKVRDLLRQAAAGAFDRHFRTLAQNLVALGVPDTILVLGWEMNGITYTHRCGPNPKHWKTYWRRIVTAMRSVPGQRFMFEFAPNRGVDDIPWPKCYPGDDVVDIIGMDSYDQPNGITFDEQVSEPYGLQFHVDFAKAHGKPIAYPEWGLFRNGDNVTYMLRMLAWLDEHKPLYHTVTDYCPHGVWECSANSRASAVYRAVVSGQYAPDPGPEPSVPSPRPPTASVEPRPTPHPTPHPTPSWPRPAE
ncbi:hypothetical protein K4749_33075 [Streptomyces sp. TRM72054]|uniref:glycoside hydrolase family 26 protein n=1 Tax=Streptomyces sp. TRM72054 TaxID=2870562 RepID=UPI001C8CF0EF|nr:glycosyl hydrolase [Streptomyces sp. TRM72054]MBX9398296.1 hypothetical protein [Streptomyces sp. TRM72054]